MTEPITDKQIILDALRAGKRVTMEQLFTFERLDDTWFYIDDEEVKIDFNVMIYLEYEGWVNCHVTSGPYRDVYTYSLVTNGKTDTSHQDE